MASKSSQILLFMMLLIVSLTSSFYLEVLGVDNLKGSKVLQSEKETLKRKGPA